MGVHLDLDWCTDMSKAPPNTRIIVNDKAMYDTWGTFDPTWGKGRGAWFNDKNQIIAGVWRWHPNSDAYVANRLTGPGIVPIR